MASAASKLASASAGRLRLCSAPPLLLWASA
jgi:hypothetical protein